MTMKMTVEVMTLADLRRAVNLMEKAEVDVETTGFTFSRRLGGSLITIEPESDSDEKSSDTPS